MLHQEQQSHLTQDERMIARQAALISQLNDTIRALKSNEEKLHIRLSEVEASHEMYTSIIRAVQENPPLQGIWDELVTTMRLLDIKFK